MASRRPNRTAVPPPPPVDRCTNATQGRFDKVVRPGRSLRLKPEARFQARVQHRCGRSMARGTNSTANGAIPYRNDYVKQLFLSAFLVQHVTKPYRLGREVFIVNAIRSEHMRLTTRYLYTAGDHGVQFIGIVGQQTHPVNGHDL
jgi:hypothetical protein